MAFVTATNAYIEKRAPWKLGKSTEAKDQALLRTSLATMAEALRLAVALMQHVTPATTEEDQCSARLRARCGAGGRNCSWGASLNGAKSRKRWCCFRGLRKERSSRRSNVM